MIIIQERTANGVSTFAETYTLSISSATRMARHRA
jgi:hypothetical protein